MIKKILRYLLVFFLLCNPFLFAGQDKELEEKRKRLLEIQKQINEEKEREEKVRVFEKKEKQALGIVEKDLVKTKKELEKHKKEIISTKKNLRITEINLKKKEKALRDYQDLLASRISAFYRNIFFSLDELNKPEQGYLNFLASNCVSLFHVLNLEKRLKVFGIFASENANLIRETEFQKKVIGWEKKVLKTKEIKLARTKTEKEKKIEELESKKKEKEGSIYKAKAELKESFKKQEELRRTARELENMIKKLVAKKSVPPEILKREAMLFERDKDNLPWPVSRGKIVNYFGWTSSQQYATSIFNSGIDIEIDREENVCAVSKGVVLFSGTFRSYGKTVIIDHGGGYCSVYSNLSEITVKKNQEVKSGGVIGTVLSSLHFEMRKDTKTIDPLEWLKNR